jgi:hypothetical protein
MPMKLEGFREWEAKLKDAEKALGFVPAATLSEVMKIGFKIAYDEAPQGETGFLKSSINYEIFMDSSGSEVGELRADAPYAGYVNDGTSRRKRVPFFSNAVIAMNIAVFRIMEKNTKAALQGNINKVFERTEGKRGGNPQLRSRKHLYQSYSRSGKKRYIYAKGNRPGTVKFRGKIYRGRNYSGRFESA